LRELENELDKTNRENMTLTLQIEDSKNVTETQDYITLLNEFKNLQEEYENKDSQFQEMKYEFSKKLNEFQQISQDFNDCKHALQDLEYGYNNLEAQKKEKDDRLKQMVHKNESLAEQIQLIAKENEKKKNYELEDTKRRIKQVEESNGSFENSLKTCRSKTNE